MVDTFADDTARLKFRSIFSLLSRFRTLDKEMPVQQMLVFCWVALNEGRTQRELCVSLDMPSSTASRNLAALSKVHRLGKEGLGLIEWREDPMDRRSKLLWLTTKGQQTITKLLSDL